jgi:hypothetical protein
MQITPFTIYLLERLAVFQFLIFVPTVCIGIFVGIGSIIGTIDEDGSISAFLKHSNFKWVRRFLIFGVLFLIFVPSKEDVITMWVVPKIVNSDVAQKDIPELINLTIKDIKKKLE